MSPSSRDVPRLSVLVLSWNTSDLTVACLSALAAETPRHARRVHVLDNASADASPQVIAERFPDLALDLSNENTGYAGGNNRLARQADGDYLCLLGSDTEVRPGALDALVDFLDANSDYDIAAPRLVGTDGAVQCACMRFPNLRVAFVYDMFYRRWPLLRRIDDAYFYRDFDHLHDADVEQPPGTCLMIRRSVWERLGGMDENLWLFFNDVDLCLRAKRSGSKVRYLAGPEVMHHGGASTKEFASVVATWAKDRMAFYRKFYGAFGYGFVRLMIRMRAWQEWWALGRRHENPKHRRDSRAELKRVLREVLS